jgi:basic membrane protein A and related proteins
MLLGSGGLGDRSFNDSAYSGLLEAQKKFNIRFDTVDPAGKEADLESVRFFAEHKYDLIIGIGFEHLETIKTVAQEFPSVKFGAVDFELASDNVASIVYREQEGDFLIGVLSALLTKTRTVGVIGGADIPAIRRIISGFKQGVTYQDSGVSVHVDLAGTFSDPDVGLKLALSQYKQGVDVIHNAASRTGLGIIEAAKQTGKLTTGTSGDQRYLASGNVVGNRPKRVDTAVMLLIEEVKEGQFKSGIRSLGLKENGLSLGPFDESLVTKPMLDRLESLKQQIINGQVTVKVE